MKKIGLVSLPRYFNYGSQLQLYALQTSIEEVGFICEVLDYAIADPPPLPLVDRIFRIASQPSLLLTAIPARYFQRSLRLKARKRMELSARFESEFIHMGRCKYNSLQDFHAKPPDHAAFVVGSDQVWSPLGHAGDSVYFLSFAKPEQRIAYAPSIGVSQVPDYALEWLKTGVSGIRHLSVRERQGAEIIRAICARDAEWVVDPTLLLDSAQWNRLATLPELPDRYVLVYALSSDLYIRAAAIRAAAELNAKVVVLPFDAVDVLDSSKQCYKAFDVGPREFLGAVRNAQAVFTDSFHGTVFSVIFKRPFCTFRRYEDKGESATISRMESLLGRLGLSDQLYGIDSQNLGRAPVIDFSACDHALASWRKNSSDFLTNALRTATSA